jgi:hypothetical protein
VPVHGGGRGVGISAKVVAREIGKRYHEGGLERALYDAPRRARINCWTPSTASASSLAQPWIRWTARDRPESGEAKVDRALFVPETVQILFQSHELEPRRERMWYVANLDGEYIRRIEDVLELYESRSRETLIKCRVHSLIRETLIKCRVHSLIR